MTMRNDTEQLDEILAAYLEAEAAGWAPRRDYLVRCYPQFAERIEAFFADEERVGRAAGSVAERAAAVTVDERMPTGEAGWPRVPGYEILGEIARGGMGVVYKARQATPDRVVALKVVLAGGHAGAAERERFRREAEAIARLEHPGVVRVWEVGEHEGLPFFSMEYCPGGSLADRLDGTPWVPAEAARLVAALAGPVEACHARGIVHRDLKPGNVLMADEGTTKHTKDTKEDNEEEPEDSSSSFRVFRVFRGSTLPKLTDFGLAKLLDLQSQTASNAALGTPSYMAPEQAGQNKRIGPQADVYALGAILYELLTGRPPFKAATALETILQVLGDEVVPPGQLQPRTPADLERICLKCLEKQPERRYGSARELGEDLGRYLRGEPVTARPVGAGERTMKWIKRNAVVSALATAVGVVLLAGVVVSGYFAMMATEEAKAARAAEGEADERAKTEAAAKAEVQREKRRAEQQLKRAEWLVYAGKLSLAQSAFLEGNGRVAMLHLDECQWNLRGWEHRYLWTHFNSNQTLRGHTSVVSSVAWSPDGKRILTGSDDGTAKVWDAERGQEVLSLKGHTKPITSAAWSPDGNRILTGSTDNTAKVWDAERGQEVLSLKGHTKPITSVAWSPDGKRILTGSGDHTAKVWDAARGQEVLSLKGHKLHVWSVAWCPDGNRILTGSWDKTAKVWDAEKSQDVLSLKGPTGGVISLTFSPDNTCIFGSTEHAGIIAWDVQTGHRLPDAPQQLPPGSRRTTLPDGRYLRIQGTSIELVDPALEKANLAHERAFSQRLGSFDPAYHLRQLAEAERDKNAFAAAFHRRWLLRKQP